MISSLEQLDRSKEYSYAEYLSWKFEQAIELLKGKIAPMSAPTRHHQRLAFELTLVFGNFLKKQGRGCQIYTAPFDVRLVKNPAGKSDKEIYTVVQPDLCVVCDMSKLDDRGCLGAPDLIIEIVSEGSLRRDVHDKFELYQESGVQEYWIARYMEKTIQVFFLEGERYVYKGTFTQEDTISPIILPELSIVMAELFD